jgi:hypothetical protein
MTAVPSVKPPWGDARRSSPFEQEIVGTPLLLWRVEHEQSSSECVIAERPDGQFWARVIRDGAERAHALFDSEGEAIAWALDREHELVEHGWRHVL